MRRILWLLLLLGTCVGAQAQTCTQTLADCPNARFNSVTANTITAPGGAFGITINTTGTTGGTNGYLLYDNNGTVGEEQFSSMSVGGGQISAGSIPNSALTNASTTVNGQTCTLGGTCTITASAGGITSGSTTITGGSNGYLLYDNAGVLGLESVNSVISAGVFNQTSSGQIFTGSGANIDRLNDRLFLGTATLNDGNASPTTMDWTKTTYAVGGVGAFEYLEQNGMLNVGEIKGALPIVAVGRSSDGTASAGAALIGVSSAVVNDNTGTGGVDTWNFYGTTVRAAGATGVSTINLETDSANLGSAVTLLPSAPFASGETVGLQLAVGGELAGQASGGYTFNNSSAAIVIVANNPQNYANVKWGAGIIFAANALNNFNAAIEFASGHQMNWYNSSGVETGSIASTATTAATGQQIVMGPSGTLVTDMSGANQFQITNTISSAANWILVTPGSGTAAPAVSANSSTNPNVGLTLSGKGNAGVGIQGSSNGTSAASGQWGEFVSAETTGYASLSNNTPANLISMSLGAGDWDIWGNVQYQTGTFNVSAAVAWISSTSGTEPSGPNNGGITAWVSGSGGAVTGTAPLMSAGYQRQVLSSTTTFYCQTLTQFSGTMGGHCFMAARRRR